MLQFVTIPAETRSKKEPKVIFPMRYNIMAMRRLNAAPLSLRGMAALCAILALTACNGTAQDAAGRPGYTDGQAVAPPSDESTVPIVRPLPLVEMSLPVVVDFNLLPPGPDATSTLFLGIRVNAESAAQSALASDGVIAAGLDVDVSLFRVQDSNTQAVPLVRIESSGQAPAVLVPVGPRGRVAGVRRDDVDDISIAQNGRASAAGHSRYLSFALAQNPAPGRYRLSVRISKASAELSGVRSELLVAYRHRSK